MGGRLAVLSSTNVFIAVGITANWCAFMSQFRWGSWFVCRGGKME